jgi:hypothetical protein
MGKGSLSYAATVILQAISSGYLYGFDIIDITGLPGGTVYPPSSPRRSRLSVVAMEKPNIAQAEPRPQRKYYELTRPGREILAEAVKRYRLLDRTPPRKQRQPKPSRA